MTKGNRMRIAVIAGLLVAGLDPARDTAVRAEHVMDGAMPRGVSDG